MAEPIGEEVGSSLPGENVSKIESLAGLSGKDRRKVVKKLKRKQNRREIAVRQLAEEEARLNDPQEQLQIQLAEKEEAERCEKVRKEYEERERLWLEAAAARKAEEEAQKKLLEESQALQVEQNKESDEEDHWEYVDEGPAEIIWQGNEIIVKKKRVKVSKGNVDQQPEKEDSERPTSNPLPPQSSVFAAYKNNSSATAQQVFDTVAQQTPNFGTEQDKAHCPFHIKTGACRFGSRCSRVHFYPDKSCTLLVKNMYNGPGLAWEQDEGLEYTDEEVERCYEEFYEDVHTEFLKFGEIVNFKVCRNGAFHLRGNVYAHYKSLESAVLAYNSINGRYFAGKQIFCEFVGVTRWKVAICGEYMKSRLKTCSHGTACNFIHCFRNPGGDYEWADWDNPPPKYWMRKMAVLFGTSDEMESSDVDPENGNTYHFSRKRRADVSSYRHRRSGSGEHFWNSDGEYPDEKRAEHRNRSSSHRSSKRKETDSFSELIQSHKRRHAEDHSGRDHNDYNRHKCGPSSRKQSSARKKEQNQDSDNDHHLYDGMHDSPDQDSIRCYGSNRDASHGRRHKWSKRRELDSPIDSSISAENSNRETYERCDEVSQSYAHSSELNRYQSSSRRTFSNSQRKYMDDSLFKDEGLEWKVGFQDHEKRSRNYGSSFDHSSNIVHDDSGQGHTQSWKWKGNDSMEEVLEIDEHDRYDGRYGSSDQNSDENYKSKEARRKNTSSRKEKTGYSEKDNASLSKRSEPEHKDKKVGEINLNKHSDNSRQLYPRERNCDRTFRPRSGSSSDDSYDLTERHQSRHRGKGRREGRKRNARGENGDSDGEGGVKRGK